MFKKYYLVCFYNKNNQLIKVPLKLNKDTADNLANQDIDLYKVQSIDTYKVPKVLPKQNYKLYLSFLFQDICKGKVFNSLRYRFYLNVLQTDDRVLTDKQKKYLEDKVDTSLTTKSSGFYMPEQQKNKLKKIILISSRTAGVGKSTLASILEESLNNSINLSIADRIRSSLDLALYEAVQDEKNLFEPDYYLNNKNKVQTHYPDTNDFCIRDLLCDYSDLLQKHLGEDLWAKTYSKTVDNSNVEYVITDDLRRNIELEKLIQIYGKENILTIYLDKEDITSKLSDTAKKYEGQVNPDSYDIKFTYNSDWSNQDLLLTEIKNKLN